MRKVAGGHPFCVLIYMNSYLFHICFILFILLSYLIFDFVCLTISSADTHGIARYARTYIRDTHTHAHTHTHKKVERLGKKNRQKKRGGQERKKAGKNRGRMEKGEKEGENEGIRGEEGKKERKKRKREGNGFRGVEERGY